ncbi:MAG: feruloyl-CoA synthase [Hyphomicrobiaceae bacterium]|nr:feruloyl-CoA synthase [Hyphomicrobiaceae bacterium]
MAQSVINDAPYRNVHFGTSTVHIEKRADGTIIATSPTPLGNYPNKTTERLDYWAEKTPDAVFLAQRDGSGPWRKITYAEARASARAIAQALLSRPLSHNRPIAILSGNDLGQALMALGAQYAGIPFAPISPAYSTISQDFGKLRTIFEVLDPGLVYATTGSPIAKAIEAIVPATTEIVVAADPPPGHKVTLLADLIKTPVTPAVDAANATIGPNTVAKILFTSGSTGVPKGVINTQRMMCSNQQMFGQVLPFFAEEPPVLVEWLPWSHTFGGNHNFNMVLFNGGSLYIDDGRPLPGAINTTVQNLREIAPTIYFNVPRGYETLLPFLESDPALAKTFFSRVRCLFYAGASLPQPIWDRLQAVAVKTIGNRIIMMSGLGSTETAPGAITVARTIERAGTVGVPMPGVELKLIPNSGKLEARLRGPNIMPGYWKNTEQTKKVFDDEGFYMLGDALKFADPNDPNAGFVFDGRIAEDFKLLTGTWVSVGPLRGELIHHFAPLIRDAVIAGHDRNEITALLVPDIDHCRALTGAAPSATAAEVLGHSAVVSKFRELLTSLSAKSTGASSRVPRIMLLHEMLSIDAGEVTDKGSINQRSVLANRASLVQDLYADSASPRVIALPKKT